MSHAPDTALVRAVRQNAATLSLLGVDFMPVRLRDEVDVPASTIEPKPAPLVPALPAAEPKSASPRAAAAGAQPQHPVGAGRSRERSQQLLDALRARYEREAPHKAFVTDHHNIVFGEGDPCARLMFVGEAPGAEEDRVGRPFVGRSGQLLEKMIGAMGLARSDVYIANVLKTRPPDNATPTTDECAACAPFLYEQILIVRPEAIVTLGLPASRTLLNSMDSMSSLRGRWHQFRPPASLRVSAAADLEPDWSVPLMPTYHPAFLLRSYTAENRGKVWADLQQVMERLGLGAAKPESSKLPD